MALTSQASRSNSIATAVLPDKPHQPLQFSFPKRSFGKKVVVQRSCQATWFSTWKWLHYQESEDSLLCYFCLKATREKRVVVTSNLGSCDQAFVSSFNVVGTLK